MKKRLKKQTIFVLALVAGLFLLVSGCTFPQAGADETMYSSGSSSSVSGSWESSSGLVEEQLLRGSGVDSGTASSGTAEGDHAKERRFRNTTEGEPKAIHQFINRVLVDDEFALITLRAKTADDLGDAGFILEVENKYKPLTASGYDNYCYITPVMGTWTVNGVPVDPLAEGNIFPKRPGTIYLYFDDFNSVEDLVEVKGTFELYLISDWWNPVGVYEFSQA